MCRWKVYVCLVLSVCCKNASVLCDTKCHTRHIIRLYLMSVVSVFDMFYAVKM